ncbi:MAG: hypothetical protein RML36_15220 [Anaerolineae bacterium]|nr:hypothetical protein [Anaerolineae bacterium]
MRLAAISKKLPTRRAIDQRIDDMLKFYHGFGPYAILSLSRSGAIWERGLTDTSVLCSPDGKFWYLVSSHEGFRLNAFQRGYKDKWPLALLILHVGDPHTSLFRFTEAHSGVYQWIDKKTKDSVMRLLMGAGCDKPEIITDKHVWFEFHWGRGLTERWVYEYNRVAVKYRPLLLTPDGAEIDWFRNPPQYRVSYNSLSHALPLVATSLAYGSGTEELEAYARQRLGSHLVKTAVFWPPSFVGLPHLENSPTYFFFVPPGKACSGITPKLAILNGGMACVEAYAATPIFGMVFEIWITRRWSDFAHAIVATIWHVDHSSQAMFHGALGEISQGPIFRGGSGVYIDLGYACRIKREYFEQGKLQEEWPAELRYYHVEPGGSLLVILSRYKRFLISPEPFIGMLDGNSGYLIGTYHNPGPFVKHDLRSPIELRKMMGDHYGYIRYNEIGYPATGEWERTSEVRYYSWQPLSAPVTSSLYFFTHRLERKYFGYFGEGGTLEEVSIGEPLWKQDEQR